MRLGHCIRQLKQLWPAGCVLAALAHEQAGAGEGGGVDVAASGDLGFAADDEDDSGAAASTQRRWRCGGVGGLCRPLWSYHRRHCAICCA